MSKRGEVKLADGVWYACEILARHEADDYEGVRFDVRLVGDASKSSVPSVTKYSRGHVFRGAHRNCVVEALSF